MSLLATTAIFRSANSLILASRCFSRRPSSRSFAVASPLSVEFLRFITFSNNVEPFGNCDLDQFYNYTSGRWLWKEKDQLSRRYIKFNLSGLLEVSKQAMGARSCVNVTKLPEGSFSKVFLIETDDGRDLIAKLPNPNAGPPHLVTASEVATMDYVRSYLDIPAPRVYGWSSSTDNPVGAEYILMGRCQGVELENVWDTMRGDDKIAILSNLVRYEKALVSPNMPMYGSLYYAKDLCQPSSSQVLGSAGATGKKTIFALGPTTHRKYFDEGRDAVGIDRGPCKFDGDTFALDCNQSKAFF